MGSHDLSFASFDTIVGIYTHRYTLSLSSNKGVGLNGAAYNCINVCLLNVVIIML